MNMLNQFEQIITRNMKVDLKNIISDMITSFNTPYSIKNYEQFIIEFDKFTSNLSISYYEKLIQTLDEEFMNTSMRKQLYFSKGYVTKPLLTKFGYISFKRRRYVNKETSESYMFVDRFLGLERYTRMDPFVIAELVEESATNSYAKAGRIVSKNVGDRIKYNDNPNKYIINRATTRNNVLKASKLIIEPDNEEQKIVEELNIMLDEKYVGSQFNDGKDHMIKAAVLFHGTRREYGKRIRLTGKHVFGNTDDGITSLLNEVLDYIYYNYDTDKLKRINFMGDGALWIKSFSLDTSFKYHKDIIIKFALDAFHTFQAIQHIVTNKHKNFTPILTDYLIHNMKDDFILVCNTIKELEQNREKTIEEKLDYILNNWEYIQSSFHEVKYKCSMESNISHVFADIFTSRPKAYSKEGIKGLLKIRLLHVNGYDLKKLYIDSLHEIKEEEKIKKLEKKIKIKKSLKHIGLINMKVPLLQAPIKSSGTIRALVN